MGEKRFARRLVKSVDTNILVRVLMNDDPAQAAAAWVVLEAGVLVTQTVLLEMVWLLRSRYGLSRLETIDALLTVRDIPGLVLVGGDLIGWAISRFAEGGDFADLIHIAASHGAEEFLTFDRGIARAAGPDSPVPIETLT